MTHTRVTAICLMLLLSLPALAVSVGGVEVPEQVRIEGQAQALSLNGAGVRKKFFFSIYVAALYLPRVENDAARLLADPPANRVLMHFVYDTVEADKIVESWREGFDNNLGEVDRQKLEARLQQFSALFGDMHAGDRVWLDYFPGRGTVVSVNGIRRGEVEGADFNAALLGVWLGSDPVSESLKKALVGVDKL